MRIKKFVADSAKEALLQVREELGPRAVILKTQRTSSKSLFGFMGKSKVEVTAALDENLFARPEGQPAAGSEASGTNPAPAPNGTFTRYDRTGRKTLSSAEPDAGSERRSTFTDEKFRLAEIHDDVEEVKSVLRNLADHIRHQDLPPLPERVSELCCRLIEGEVARELAVKTGVRLQGMLNDTEMENDKIIFEKAVEILAGMIQASGPLGLKNKSASRVLFVGPTGNGKTTTLAKLAAQYGIQRRKRVRILTADTYRIAAVEQLRTFAEISDIPMDVVFTPEEMRRAIVKMSASSDLILIDTAGRSQLNEEHMGDLKEFIDAADPDETHLVLSATTKYSDLCDIADRYRLLGVNRYLFTKLDETRRFGHLFTLLAQSKVPFSYLTAGQSVPDDIEEGQSVRLAQMVAAQKPREPGERS